MKQNAYFIHRHLAEQADARLQIVSRTPKHIVLAGADGDVSRKLLAARYPNATFCETDPHAERLNFAQQQRQQTGFFRQLLNKKIPQFCQKTDERLPENQIGDMLWANLHLIWADDLIATIENWATMLRDDGLLFFTHFGAGSLPEMRQFVDFKNDLLRDMHDLGDMLFHHGFYDPIMDTATLVLDYENVDTFIADIAETGLWRDWAVDNFENALQIINQAWQNGHLRQISVEILHGHALKKAVLPENTSVVQFYPRKNGA